MGENIVITITMSGKASDLLNDEAVQKAYLGE